MGGRVTSMLADNLFGLVRFHGLLCLGYPFPPPVKPRRDAHVDLKLPMLIVQGTVDQLGMWEDASAYILSWVLKFLWLDDDDHHLKPR
jgi:predicted alpha/beta-hydrolase family hydrolase